MPASIPESHLDLIRDNIVVGLTTVLPDGALQSTAVWCLYEDGYVYISTSKQSRKAKNLAERPQANILVIDPKDPGRYIELRGEVDEITSENAAEKLREIIKLYNSSEDYFNMEDPNRVLIRFVPQKVIVR